MEKMPPRRRHRVASRGAEFDALRSPPTRGSRLSPMSTPVETPERAGAGKKAWGAPLSTPKGGIVPPTPSPAGRLGAGRKTLPLKSNPSTLEVVSTQRKTREKNLKETSLRDPAFKEVVAKYWQAMTDNGKLLSVNFSLYNLVHMRISKTLEPSFTEEEARDVAKQDFKSDTKGKPEMKRQQLSLSLYELACVWAKSQMEQSGLTCETQHLVYFLNQMFHNIADELIIEARRVVKLKELQDIKAINTNIATSFRLLFNIDSAKQKLLSAAARAAAEAEEEKIRAEKAEADRIDVLRLRDLAEARRRAEECAAWRRDMACHQAELNQWMRTLQAAKARVGQAMYELGQEEQLAMDQRKEIESLMRAQVQLALATGGQLIPGGQLLAVRVRWEELSRLLAGTERRIVEREVQLDEARAALACLPPQPPAPVRRSRGPMVPVKHRSAWAC